MTYVVDALMGTGKTSAAINFMNAHYKDRRFLYIVPYNEEAARIIRDCPLLKFAAPDNTSREGNYTKSGDLKKLVARGRNVAMSHELYSIADIETIEAINQMGYTIIIDEVVDVFRVPAQRPLDIDILVRSGFIVPDESMSTDKYTFYRPGGEEYDALMYKDVFRLVKSRRLVCINDAPLNVRYYCWMLNQDAFKCSVDTYILTYLFEGSPMYGYFKVNNIPYTKIGVKKTPDGYQFSDNGDLPEMAHHIRDYIEILDHKKMNAIGDKYNALSKTWYDKQPVKKAKVTAVEAGDKLLEELEDMQCGADNGGERFATDGIDVLRRNLMNYFKNIHPCRSKDQMWTTFQTYKPRITSSGYQNSFVSWNMRSTNKFGQKTVLAFLTNIFLNPSLKLFLDSKGSAFSQDQYALSALVQWIWRSAIRNGQKVYLYLPSSRMRRLLNEWMDSLVSGNDAASDELVA